MNNELSGIGAYIVAFALPQKIIVTLGNPRTNSRYRGRMKVRQDRVGGVDFCEYGEWNKRLGCQATSSASRPTYTYFPPT